MSVHTLIVLLGIAFTVAFLGGLLLLSRLEEATEQADEARPMEGERMVEQAAGERGLDASQSATAERLRELKALLDDGLITKSEFEAKRAELLREL